MKHHSLSDITVETWVQGGPLTLETLIGSVVLVEVFQVNCPGCFLYTLPEAIHLYETFQNDGLVVIGLATAFEDYDKNTIGNLRRLVERSEVIGETQQALTRQGMLPEGKLDWRLPFPVGMDRVAPDTEPVTKERTLEYARKIIPGFDVLPAEKKHTASNQIRAYLGQKSMKAETFERFALRGTPSSILFDRKGHVEDVSFGRTENLQHLIKQCLAKVN